MVRGSGHHESVGSHHRSGGRHHHSGGGYRNSGGGGGFGRIERSVDRDTSYNFGFSSYSSSNYRSDFDSEMEVECGICSSLFIFIILLIFSPATLNFELNKGESQRIHVMSSILTKSIEMEVSGDDSAFIYHILSRCPPLTGPKITIQDKAPLSLGEGDYEYDYYHLKPGSHIEATLDVKTSVGDLLLIRGKSNFYYFVNRDVIEELLKTESDDSYDDDDDRYTSTTTTTTHSTTTSYSGSPKSTTTSTTHTSSTTKPSSSHLSKLLSHDDDDRYHYHDDRYNYIHRYNYRDDDYHRSTRQLRRYHNDDNYNRRYQDDDRRNDSHDDNYDRNANLPGLVGKAQAASLLKPATMSYSVRYEDIYYVIYDNNQNVTLTGDSKIDVTLTSYNLQGYTPNTRNCQYNGAICQIKLDFSSRIGCVLVTTNSQSKANNTTTSKSDYEYINENPIPIKITRYRRWFPIFMISIFPLLIVLCKSLFFYLTKEVMKFNRYIRDHPFFSFPKKSEAKHKPQVSSVTNTSTTHKYERKPLYSEEQQNNKSNYGANEHKGTDSFDNYEEISARNRKLFKHHSSIEESVTSRPTSNRKLRRHHSSSEGSVTSWPELRHRPHVAWNDSDNQDLRFENEKEEVRFERVSTSTKHNDEKNALYSEEQQNNKSNYGADERTYDQRFQRKELDSFDSFKKKSERNREFEKSYSSMEESYSPSQEKRTYDEESLPESIEEDLMDSQKLYPFASAPPKGTR